MNGGPLSTFIGISALALGSISVLTCLGNSPAIIDTGFGNGANAVVSAFTALVGWKIWKLGNGLAAVVFGLLVASLTAYGGYSVDHVRAISVVTNAGTAAISATGAAAGAAVNSVQQPRVIQARIPAPAANRNNGLKGGHRWLTDLEREWCTKRNSKSTGCKTHQCPINGVNGQKGCGVRGKTKADVRGK